MKKNLFLFLTVFCFGLFFAGISPVLALTVSPLRQTLVAVPGEEYILSIIVKNDATIAKTFASKVEAFSLDANGKMVFETESEAKNWLEPEVERFILEPNKEKKVNFSVNTPENALPGTNYLLLSALELGDGSGNVAISSKVSSLLFLYVEGEVIEDLVKNKFETNQYFYLKLPVFFNLSLENKGTIHATPVGDLKIFDVFGNSVFEKRINPEMRKVLPYGFFDEEISVDALPKKAFGPLRAVLTVKYGITQNTITDTAYFWYLPPWIFLILGLILFWIVFMRFWFKKKKIKYDI